MNQKQVAQIVVALLSWLSTKYGFHLDTAMADTITLLVTMAFNHYWHTDPPTGSGSNNSPTSLAGKIPLLFLVGSVAGALVLSGCKSSPLATAYKAETVSDATISAAMSAWGDYVAQYHPPASQEAQVKAAFEKVQAAELEVNSLTTLYAQTGSTNVLAGLASNTTTEVQAFNDLVNLLRAFGVKL